MTHSLTIDISFEIFKHVLKEKKKDVLSRLIELYEICRLTVIMESGTSQSGQAAKRILSTKNGDQQNVNVKKTRPKTFYRNFKLN